MPKTGKILLEYLGWISVSVVIWCWAFVEVNALYPDWNDKRGEMLGRLIRAVVILSWSLWLLSFSTRKLLKARFSFKIGICLALILSLIRLVFYKEFNELADYLSHAK